MRPKRRSAEDKWCNHNAVMLNAHYNCENVVRTCNHHHWQLCTMNGCKNSYSDAAIHDYLMQLRRHAIRFHRSKPTAQRDYESGSKKRVHPYEWITSVFELVWWMSWQKWMYSQLSLSILFVRMNLTWFIPSFCAKPLLNLCNRTSPSSPYRSCCEALVSCSTCTMETISFLFSLSVSLAVVSISISILRRSQN